MSGVRAWFYDTWGFLALANARDDDHAVAEAADRWREERSITVVTTDFVLDETLTALHNVAGAAVTLRFLDYMEAQVDAGTALLVGIDSVRRDESLRTFRALAPRVPRLSFTDCTSFVVMRELDVRKAFTADGHFLRAGEGIRPLFELRRGRVEWEPSE